MRPKGVNIDWLISGVSIHAPVKGATKNPVCILSRHTGFNSRTRKGCDFNFLNDRVKEIRVSIHAPVKGATFGRKSPEEAPAFQFTHP